MGDAGDNGGYERRLAGQPVEPTASTQELHVAARDGQRTAAELTLGDVSVAGVAPVLDASRRGSALVAWVVAAVLGLALAAVVFGGLGSARDRVTVLERSLEAAQLNVAEQRQRIEKLEREAVELRAANATLAAEAEARAAEFETMQRADEERTAIENRTPAKPSPKSGRKRGRKRTRHR